MKILFLSYAISLVWCIKMCRLWPTLYIADKMWKTENKVVILYLLL